MGGGKWRGACDGVGTMDIAHRKGCGVMLSIFYFATCSAG